ncbi:TrbL/VirB6 family protein [Lyticum sinuosum]|uniref:Type IV secretion system protein VirB6 n=1 Tax=Lyticum sinuosum TaxID=1332059 RepID=A0AAE4VKD7_9RICK|nr:type IV secretion system protein [Lyticum sinuosum]MDZ5761412.1 Type IV secretion system protein VirB6 [Lyticum sinuosum]
MVNILKFNLNKIIICCIISIIGIFIVSTNLSSEVLSVYRECYFNYEGMFSTSKEEDANITTINIGQNIDCKGDCESKCKLNLLQGINRNLNSDQIENLNPLIKSTFIGCMSSCMKGENYIGPAIMSVEVTPSSGIKGQNTVQLQKNGISGIKNKYYYYGPLKQIEGCKRSAKDIPTITDYGSIRGEKTITVKIDFSKKNTVYKCGRKSRIMTPTYPNLSGFTPEVMTSYNASYNMEKYNKAKNSIKPENNINIIDPYFNYPEMTFGILKKKQLKRYNSSGEPRDAVYVHSDLIDKIIANSFDDKLKPSLEWCLDRDFNNCMSNSSKNNSPKLSHPCYSVLSSNEWKTVSSRMLTECKTNPKGYPIGNCRLRELLSGDKDINNINKNPNCYPEWHIYNENPVYTGIDVKNGDKLSISWYGNIFVNISSYIDSNVLSQYKNNINDTNDVKTIRNNIGLPYFENDYDKSIYPIYVDIKSNLVAMGRDYFSSLDLRKDLINSLEDHAGLGNSLNFAQQMFRRILQLSTSIGDISYALENEGNIYVESDSLNIYMSIHEDDPIYRICKSLNLKTKLKKWNGLDGYLYPSGSSPISQEDDEDKDNNIDITTDESNHKNKLENNYYCNDIRDPGLVRVSYSGILSGIPNERTPFSIKPSVFDTDNFLAGGFEVEIYWESSSVNVRSVNIQYAILKKGQNKDHVTWNSLNTFNINNFMFSNTVISHDGSDANLLFRIDPNSINYSNEGTCTINDQSGEYTLEVQTLSEKNSILYNMIKHVLQTLYGKNACVVGESMSENAVVPRVYSATIEQIAKYVKPLLVIFIMVTVISFVMGIVSFNQKEFLMLCIKFSFVVAMTTVASSWELFGEKIANLTVCGSIDLAAKYTPSISVTENIVTLEKQEDPLKIFNELSKEFSLLLSKLVWTKIFALVANGLSCFALAIVIIYSLIKMLILAIKVALMYLMSLINMSILVIIMPLVSVFMLFKTTRHIFDATVKYAIMFTILPAAIFCVFSIFNLVILQLIIATFNYTVCKVCLISLTDISPILKVFGLDREYFCLCHGAKFLFDFHTSENAESFTLYVPTGIASAAIALLSMMYVANAFLDNISSMLYRMIGVGAAQAGDGASGVQGAADSIMRTTLINPKNMNPIQGGGAIFQNIMAKTKTGASYINKKLYERKVRRK